MLRRLTIAPLAAALVAAALMAPAAGAATPQGKIREVGIPSNVVDIAPGPGGDLWFTENEIDRIGRVTPAGKVTRFPLPNGVEPLKLVEGPEGNIWFTYEGGNFGYSTGGVGRMTPAGKVDVFPEAEAVEGAPWEIVVGSDGNLWFDHVAIFELAHGGIGRITPQGQITEFGAGLNNGADVENLVLGADGDVWFGDASNHPAVGRITPAGEIVEFPGLKPQEFPIFEGPAATAAGPLYFSSNRGGAVAVEKITPAGDLTRTTAGLHGPLEYVGPFAEGAGGEMWFRVEHPGGTAIARLDQGGQATEFTECLRNVSLFGGPEYLTLGPDGNVWFTTRRSEGEARHDSAQLPGVGFVTPSGQITELRYGLLRGGDLEEMTTVGGRLWFIDREHEAIGEVAPPHGPANTFIAVGTVGGARSPKLEIRVPGPGKLQLRLPGGGRRTVKAAPTCGYADVPIPLDGKARAELKRKGKVGQRALVTFTPRGGSPFTEHLPIEIASKR